MSRKRVVIPTTIDKAGERLVALDSLATATGWERAAIVYAFTKDTSQGKRSDLVSSEQVTTRQFAALKIKGLASHNTVDFYRECWKDAIAKGEVTEVKPGERVELPDKEWPPQERNQGSRVSADPQKAIQQVIAQHGTKATATAVAAAAPDVVVEAVEQSEPVKKELTRRSAARSEQHRQSIEAQAKPLQDVADEIKAEYEKTVTGTDVPSAQTIVHINEMVIEAKLSWAIDGGEKSADLVSALNNLAATVDGWLKAVTGASDVMLTDDDLAWAEELGIDIGAQ